ncbi:MAG: tRNA (guanine(46)-N(7))-methyltransferase TrmB [Microbacteriaceae bacterium]|nr:tRNA (guanine(46)-N(7))-methyltransferase TrmB [Microbacteriaceae bacterium]
MPSPDTAPAPADETGAETGAAAPSAAPHPGRSPLPAGERERVRSFTLRGQTRMAAEYDDLLAEHGHRYLLDVPAGPSTASIADDAFVDLDAAFGRRAPLVVEIGPGNGEQLAHAAAAHPDRNFLAVEGWHPGAAKCVGNAVRAGVDNVRILEADAAQALPVVFGLEVVADESFVAGGYGVRPDGTGATTGRVDPTRPGAANPRAIEVWTFFPDPWRKSRHHKRRLVSPLFARTVAGVLEPGGAWRLATDWRDYAWWMRDVVEGAEWFDNPHLGERPDPEDEQPERGGFAPRFEGRLLTHFEERGRDEGRVPHDVVGIRRETPRPL